MLDANAIQDAVEVEPLLHELKLSYQKNSGTCVLRCPLGTHDDENPSFLFYVENKRWECRACGESGGALDLVSRHLNVKRIDAGLWLAQKFRVRILPNISPADIHTWAQNLANNSKYTNILQRKGVSPETAARYSLGFDGERVTIPIRDATGAVINVRRYDPFTTRGENKYVNLKNAWATKHLYPLDHIRAEKVVFTEGEFKALALIEKGFQGITSSGGATYWNEEWNAVFKGRDIYFLYDIDKAGKSNAAKHAKRVYTHARRVYLVELPLDPIEFPKGDVCDYFGVLGKTAADFQELLDRAKPWQPSQLREAELDPMVYPTTLAECSRSGFQRKKVELEGLISAKDTSPYVVPQKIGIYCDRDDKACVACPISSAEPNGEKGSVTVEVDLESDRLLAMVGVPAKNLQALMREACGVPAQCKSCRAQSVATVNVEDIRLVPQVAVGTSQAEHVTQPAFYIGHGLETNSPYKLQMRMYANPKTQAVVGLVTDASPAADSLETFVLTDEIRAKLLCFQPDQWTKESVIDRLSKIYADWEANVTRIYDRHDVHMFVDLLYHSPLRIKFDGQSYKGWAEGLILGDSGQGKSECSNRLREHFRMGEKVGDKSATSAGLIGGLEEIGGRWMLKWGVLVRNDKGMVTLEEAKGIHPDVIAKMTDVRSSGIAEVIKIERSRANCRTRLLWISNPRSQRKLATYNHGVEAIKELMGSLEDVRRLDMAMCVASGQVSMDTVNRTQAERPVREHVYTSDKCCASVLFAWSRKESQISFEQEAVTEILAQAKIFGKEYSSAIPLVEPADQRLKIARLATALALRTFSVNCAGMAIVRKCHVEVVCEFLHRLYQDPVMGYKKFSARVISEESLVEVNEIQTSLFKSRFTRDLIRKLMEVNSFDAVSLMNFGGFDRDLAHDVVSTLVRKNAILPYKRLFIKTPAFAEYLKKLEGSDDLKKHEERMAALMKKAGPGVDLR